MSKYASHKHFKWLVLLTVIVGTFLGRLDQTIVNLALPDIIKDFGITVSSAGWIATAYIIANAIFVPVWGKLGDTIGRKKVYIIGFSVFILGSVLAGLAWNLGSMIIFRIIQAIAGSADYPTAMAIIAVTFTKGKERAQALGIWSSSFAAASVFGPLLGGPLIDTFGWRSVFLINLPVGIVGLVMATTFINESVSGQVKKAFDWWGATLLGITLSSLVLVLDKGMDWGWMSSNSMICYFLIALFLGWFIHTEHNAEDPIVDLKFFKNNIFVSTIINNFVVFMGFIGAIFLIPVFVQTYLGYNATQTGYLFMPMALMFVLSSPIGGAFVGKVQARFIIMISTFIAGIGLYLFSFLDARSTAWDVIYPLSIMAFGLGLGMAQRTSVVASAVPESEIGVASSVLALARNIAGAFGIAIFGTIQSNSMDSHLMSIAGQSNLLVKTADNYKEFVALVALKAQIASFSTVFVIASVIVIIGGFLAYFIKIKNERLDIKVHVE